MTEPAIQIAAEIARHGAIPFSRFMELALYAPQGGFYTKGGAGGSRDFVTSPEVSTVFGELIARAIEQQWVGWGRPDPFFVVEYAAGTGALAAAILASESDCLTAMRYVAVEATEQQVRLCANRLNAVVESELLGVQEFDDDLNELVVVPNQGPLVAARQSAPAVEYPTVVLANELLDNIPFDVVDQDGQPVLVTSNGPEFDWVGEPCQPTFSKAADWVIEQLVATHPVAVWAIDYTREKSDDFGGSLDWLRTYRSGGRGTSPLADPGSQDITSDVAIDQLPTSQRQLSQAEWLTEIGALDLRAKANDQWLRNAHAPMLADLKIKSRVGEIDRLLDPDRLGGFTVLQWCNF